MVGSVLVRDGAIVGEGFHRRLGGPHAEVEALEQAGTRAQGATAYVTLEPCNHHGRTPPCCDALLKAGVGRVVACHLDPNSVVAGKGFERLRRAGVVVEVGLLVQQAVALNLPFVLSHSLGRPQVTLKWAMSLDGHIATVSGQSQWISSPEGRQWSLELREEHDAILVGSTTALEDDPRLNRRLGWASGPITRVILDRRLRQSPRGKVFDIEGPVVIYTENDSSPARRLLEERGAEVRVLAPGDVQPAQVLQDLHGRGVQSVLVEGGGEILAAFVEAELFDRVAVDCAPLLLGGDAAPSPVRGRGFSKLAAAPRLDGLRAHSRGKDQILEGYRQGCLPDLLRNVAE